jgi:hypothetical protein
MCQNDKELERAGTVNSQNQPTVYKKNRQIKEFICLFLNEGGF